MAFPIGAILFGDGSSNPATDPTHLSWDIVGDVLTVNGQFALNNSVNTARIDVLATGFDGVIKVAGETGALLQSVRVQNNGSGGSLSVAKSRGTILSPLKVQNGDILGQLIYQGQSVDVTPFSQSIGASIRSFVIESGTISPTVFGCNIRFECNAIGSGTLTEIFRIDATLGLQTRNLMPLVSANYVKTSSKLVSALTAAGTAGAGARDFVTDSTATLAAGLGNIVAGTGANAVPVYSDGTNWRIG